jgi:hypothetical protein
LKSVFKLEISSCIDDQTPLKYSFYIYANESEQKREILEGKPLKYAHFISEGANPFLTLLPL